MWGQSCDAGATGADYRRPRADQGCTDLDSRCIPGHARLFFKCHYCDKTYLSYSAMYTHMKTKHSKGPDGKPLFLPTGRGRGRPKKNSGRVTTINPECEEFFKTIDKAGGPCDPLMQMESVI